MKEDESRLEGLVTGHTFQLSLWITSMRCGCRGRQGWTPPCQSALSAILLWPTVTLIFHTDKGPSTTPGIPVGFFIRCHREWSIADGVIFEKRRHRLNSEEGRSENSSLNGSWLLPLLPVPVSSTFSCMNQSFTKATNAIQYRVLSKNGILFEPSRY